MCLFLIYEDRPLRKICHASHYDRWKSWMTVAICNDRWTPIPTFQFFGKIYLYCMNEYFYMYVYIQYKLGNSPRQSSMAQYYLYITPVYSNTKYLLVNNSQNITREARARAYCLSCPKRARAHLHRSPVHPAQKLVWIFSEFLIM